MASKEQCTERDEDGGKPKTNQREMFFSAYQRAREQRGVTLTPNPKTRSSAITQSEALRKSEYSIPDQQIESPTSSFRPDDWIRGRSKQVLTLLLFSLQSTDLATIAKLCTEKLAQNPSNHKALYMRAHTLAKLQDYPTVHCIPHQR